MIYIGLKIENFSLEKKMWKNKHTFIRAIAIQITIFRLGRLHFFLCCVFIAQVSRIYSFWHALQGIRWFVWSKR